VKSVRLCAGATLMLWAIAVSAQTHLAAADVLGQIAKAATAEVRFTEVRTLRLLKTPLVSSGYLRYTPPDRLQRESLQPVHEVVTIEGAQVLIERDGAQTAVALAAGSPPAVLVHTLRAVLSGDVKQLESMYAASAMGSIERWTLLLEPKSPQAAVREIRLAGNGGTVDQIEVLERGGDKTVTTLVR
jgi:hypothetical protein